LLIRLAEPADHERVGELTVTAYAPHTAGPTDFYIERLRDVATRAREAEVWVAEIDDEVVGAVTWTPLGSPWREIAEEGEAEFRMLAVDPAAQGRGVGRALVAHLIELARADDNHAIVMSSEAGMVAAHRLYESMGFRRTPARDWHPLPHIDLITYELPLEES
jgi:ribosomal protein S18 acetylase RimI-like enzyme